MYKRGQYIIHKAARILFLISSPALRIIKVEDGKIPPPPSHPHPTPSPPFHYPFPTHIPFPHPSSSLPCPFSSLRPTQKFFFKNSFGF